MCDARDRIVVKINDIKKVFQFHREHLKKKKSASLCFLEKFFLMPMNYIGIRVSTLDNDWMIYSS
jgi:hypothetical protein